MNKNLVKFIFGILKSNKVGIVLDKLTRNINYYPNIVIVYNIFKVHV